MKEMFWSLLFIVILSGLVVAGSEISTNFVIGEGGVDVGNYVPAGSFWSDYSNYIVGVLVILVVGYFVFKMRDRVATRRKKKVFSKKKTTKKVI